MPNRRFRKCMIVDGNHVPGSDHGNIEWEVDMEDQLNAGGTKVIVQNLAAMW